MRCRFRLANNTLNKVAGTGANVVIDTADILPEQTHTDELGADKHKQHREQHEHPFRRPLRAKYQAQHHQQQTEGEAQQSDGAAEQAQQAQRRGSEAGHQVIHQVNQTHKTVFGITEFSLGVHHRDLHRATGKSIRQNRDKGTALMAVKHRVDNMAAIGAQHAAVIAHRFTGGALNQTIDHPGGAFTEPGILAILTHGTDNVVAFVGLLHQARDLFRRVLQVSIEGDDQVAGDVAKTRHNCRVLAVVAVQQYRNYMAAFGFSGFSQHSRRVIAAAIVDQQNFILPTERRAGGIGTADKLRQALLLVIDRNNDRDLFHGRIAKHINVLTAGAVRK